MESKDNVLRKAKEELNVLAKRFCVTRVEEIPVKSLSVAMECVVENFPFELDVDIVSRFDNLSFFQIEKMLEQMSKEDQRLIFRKHLDREQSFLELMRTMKHFIENEEIKDLLSIFFIWFENKISKKPLIVVCDMTREAGFFISAWLDFAGRIAEIEHPETPAPFRQCGFGRIILFRVNDWIDEKNETFSSIVNGRSAEILTDFNIQRISCAAPVIGIANTFEEANEFKENLSKECQIICINKENDRMFDFPKCHPLALVDFMYFNFLNDFLRK